MTEAEIQAEIVRRLRAAGWLVIVTASDKRKRKQEEGLPDLLCWRDNHFLSVEVKAPGGQMRDSQWRFLETVRLHTGPNVHHVIARHPADVMPWSEEVSDDDP